MIRGLLAIWVLCFLMMNAGETYAQNQKEPVGRWRYKDDSRPVKVIIIGGSLAHWGKGNFGAFLAQSCRNVDVKNRAKTGYGAPKLKLRFRRQFLKNRLVKLQDDRFEYWLLFQGGLNSIYSPEMTIKFTSEMFALAHQQNVKVVALSLTPWGSNSSKKWRGLSGLDRHDKTRKVVRFVMGELPRNEGLGSYVTPKDKDRSEWYPGELADISINLFDGPLRHKEATVRSREGLWKRLSRSKRWRKKYPDLEATATRASEIPRWFLRPELQAFDHIHPGTEGHRIIAQQTCPKLPESWGCDCSIIDKLQWTAKGLQLLDNDQSGALSRQ